MSVEYAPVPDSNVLLSFPCAIYPVVYVGNIGGDGVHVTNTVFSHLFLVNVSKRVKLMLF